MSEIDHEFTDGIVCPFCGHEEKDDLWGIECGVVANRELRWSGVQVAFDFDPGHVWAYPPGDLERL